MTNTKSKLISVFSFPTRLFGSWLQQHQGAQAFALAAAISSFAFSPVAMAGPEGGQVRAGDATIVDAGGGRTNILQQTQSVVIDWDSFSIASDEHVDFQQLNSTSTALNRVTGGSLSEIFGLLTSNGIVLIVNPNGVVFSETARVDVGGIVATTANISNQNFMSGNYLFEAVPGSAGARIVNRGQITAADGGLVALVAPGVENSGVIGARLGRVALASGEQFTLDMYGDNLISFAGNAGQIGQLFSADGQPISLVDNSGSISADGGTVFLLAADAAGLINNAISVTGVVEANTVSEQGGEIILSAGGGVDVSGTLAATGDDAGEHGGAVDVFGDSVAVSGDINASGDAGGGAVRIGGDFHGEGAPTATNTTITSTATISADAGSNGNGGTVVVWADGDTYYAGAISAVGGASSGDGGFVEVSGKAFLVFDGTVDATAANGIGGTLLLDPTDVVIEAGGSDNVADGSSVSADSVNEMLRSGMSVVIDADNNITVNQQIDGRPLDGGTTGSGSGLTLQAGNTVFIFRPVITDDGAIVVTAGAGGITIEGEGFLAVADGVSGAGDADITLSADGNIDATNLLTLGNVSLTSASGAIEITSGLFGLNVGGTAQGIGSLVIDAAGLVTLAGARTVSGDIAISGNGISNTTNSLVSSGAVELTGGAGLVALSLSDDEDANAAVVESAGDISIDTTAAVTANRALDAGGSIRIGTALAQVASVNTGMNDLVSGGDVAIESDGNVTVGDVGGALDGVVSIASTTGNIMTGGIFGDDADADTDGDGVGSVTLSTGGSITLAGARTSADSGGDITLSGDGVTNTANSLISDNDVIIDGGAGGVTLAGADTVIDAGGDVTIDASGGVVDANGKDIAADGAIRIGQAGTEVASLVADVLDGGTSVAVDATGNITTGAITGSTTTTVALVSGGNLQTGSIVGRDTTDDGEDNAEGVGSVDLIATGTVSVAGAKAASGDVTLTGDGVSNTDRSLIASGNVSIDGGAGGVTLAGADTVIDAGGDVTIDASGGVVDANGKDIAADGAIRIGQAGTEVASLVADVLDGGTSVAVDATGNITTGAITGSTTTTVALVSGGNLQTGSIVGRDTTDDGEDNAEGVGSVDLIATGTVSVAGAKAASGDVTLTGDGVSNTDRSLIASGNVSIDGGAGGVTLAGADTVIDAGGDVTIDASGGVVDANGKDIAADGAIRIGQAGTEVASLVADVLDGGTSVAVDATGNITTGAITGSTTTTVALVSGGNLQTGSIVGRDTTDDGEDNAEGVGSVDLIATGTVSVAGAKAASGDVTLTGDGVSNTDRSLIASGNVSIDGGAGGVTLAGADTVIDAGGDVTIDASGGVVDANGKDIAADGAIRIGQAGTEVASLVADVLDGGTSVAVDATGNITTGAITGSTTTTVALVSGGNLQTGSIVGRDTTDDGEDNAEGVGSVDLIATGTVSVAGAKAASGDVTLTGDGVSNTDRSLIASGNVSIDGGAGGVTLAGADTVIDAGGDVTIDASGGVVDANGKDIAADGAIRIGQAGTEVGSLTAGVLDANGSISANAQGAISTGAIGGSTTSAVNLVAGGNITTGAIEGRDEDATLGADGVASITLAAGGAIATAGALTVGSSAISLTGNGVANTDQSLIAAGDLVIDGGTGNVTLTNGTGAGGTLVAGGNLTIDGSTSSDVSAEGDLTAGGDLRIGAPGTEVGSLTAGVLDANGSISANAQGAISTGAIGGSTTSAVNLVAGGNITTGAIEGRDEDATLGADGVASITLAAGGAIATAGALTVGSSAISLTGNGVANTDQSLIAAGDLVIDGGTGNVTLTNGTGAGGTLVAGGNLTIDGSTSSDVSAEGDLTAGGDLRIGAPGTEVGSLTAGVLDANGSISANAQGAISTGAIGGSTTSAVNLVAGGNITTGAIEGRDEDATLGADGVASITLAAGGAIATAGALTVGSSAISLTGNGVANTDQSLIAAGDLVIDGGTGNVTLTNGTGAGGTLVAGGNLTIDGSTSSDVSAEGDLTAGGDLRIGAPGTEVGSLTAGVLDANGSISANAQGAISTGAIGGSTTSAVNLVAGGNITTGAIEGRDEDATLGADGVASITLAAGGAIATAGALTVGSGAISLTGNGVANTDQSLIAASDLVIDGGTGNVTLTNGTGAGGTLVAGNDVTVASTGIIDLDGGIDTANGSVTLDAAGGSAQVIVDGAIVTPNSVSIDSAGGVYLGDGIIAGQDPADFVSIDAAGLIDIGPIRGTDRGLLGATDGVGVGAYTISLVSTDGNIYTFGLDAGAGGISIDAGSNVIEINDAIQSGGAVSIGNSAALASESCATTGGTDCPRVYLNNNIFTEGGAITVDGNVTLFEGLGVFFNQTGDVGEGNVVYRRFSTSFYDENGTFDYLTGNRAVNLTEGEGDEIQPLDRRGLIGLSASCNFEYLCDDLFNGYSLTVNNYDELFAYTESDFVLEGGQVTGVNYPDNLTVDPGDEYLLEDLASADCCSGSSDNVERRIDNLTRLLGNVVLTIDTTLGDATGGDVTFNGDVLRYEGPDTAPSDGGRTVGVSVSYVNETLSVTSGSGAIVFEDRVGFDSDGTQSIDPDSNGGGLVGRYVLGTFDLTLSSDQPVVFNTTEDMYVTSLSSDSSIVVTNAFVDPFFVTLFEIGRPDFTFDFIGTNAQPSGGGSGARGSFDGTPNINIPGSSSGSGSSGSMGSTGSGSSGSTGGSGSGATGSSGSSGSGLTSDSGTSGSGVSADSGSSGSGTSAGSGTSGSGADTGSGTSGSGASGGSGSAGSGANAGAGNTGEGGTLGNVAEPEPPAPEGDDNAPSNLEETQKEQDEAQTEDGEEQEDNNCPKSPADYADYGNGPAQGGTDGNVFLKCAEDVLAAND